MSVASDIANWFGTTIILSDVNAAKIYSWNGTTFATVFSAQPAAFIAVFSGRLWMANQATLSWTNSGSFNSLSGDSGTVNFIDGDTPPPIRALVPALGNLYVFGYSWSKVIGNLQDIGSIPSLTFQSNTATAEAGLINKWSIIPFGYSLYYASLNGMWGLYGQQPSWISEAVGGFFQNLVPANSSFSSAFGYVNQLPVIMWNIQWNNNGTNEYTNLVAQITEQQARWFRTTSSQPIFITHGVDQTNGKQKIWGVDASNNLFEMYANLVANVTSFAATRLWNFGTRGRFKEIVRSGALIGATGTSTISMVGRDENLRSYFPTLQSSNPASVLSWTYSSGAPATWKYSGGLAATFAGPAISNPLIEFTPGPIVRNWGMDLTLIGAGNVINSFGVEYEETWAEWGN